SGPYPVQSCSRSSDPLSSRNAEGALRNLSAGKQAARVRRMNAQARRSFIEQAVHTGRIDQEISPSFKIFGNWPYKSMWQRSPNPQVAVAAFDSSASRNTITITPQHWREEDSQPDTD